MTEAHAHYWVLSGPTDGGSVVGHCACGADREVPVSDGPGPGRGHRENRLHFEGNAPRPYASIARRKRSGREKVGE